MEPETILRLIGYSVDFIQTFALVGILAALTWRIAK